jgi:hypothetical protein
MSFIKEYKNVIPPLLCSFIIDKLEEEQLMGEGRLGDGRVDHNIKKCFDYKISDEIVQNSEFWKETNTFLMDLFAKYMQKYLLEYVGPEIFQLKSIEQTKQRLNSVFHGDLKISGMQIQKYIPGCYFKPHVDDIPLGPRRMVAGILYLNDVDVKDGGSTRFYNGREIQPEIGKIVLFPSTWTYLHQGTELKNGLKYIITTFAINPKTEDV